MAFCGKDCVVYQPFRACYVNFDQHLVTEIARYTLRMEKGVIEHRAIYPELFSAFPLTANRHSAQPKTLNLIRKYQSNEINFVLLIYPYGYNIVAEMRQMIEAGTDKVSKPHNQLR